jgi:hypothetical protein
MNPMKTLGHIAVALVLVAGVASLAAGQTTPAARPVPAPGSLLPPLGTNIQIAETDCTAQKIGAGIPVTSIGEPVSAVTLDAPSWKTATGAQPAYCSVDGSMAPIDRNAKPIRFRVALPASWSRRAAQMGGSGNNGIIPNLLGETGVRGGPSLLQRGFATYGSDSGHQGGFGPPTPAANDWALNDEAMANLGFMQMKKTHDAAIVIIERMYGERPRFTYYFGASQGGREALTVAQRYPADYDGVAANVPILNFSSLMLGPELIRIQEKRLANWVTPAKVNAIRTEFVRQCDKLDGLTDGVINNYAACRALFDAKQGPAGRHPWAAKRCPDGVDPDPADTSAAACLTDGQIATLEMVYSRYAFATPLANGVETFGMWVPNTDPAGSGLISPARYRGQEGAPAEASLHSHLGILGVVGFLMKDLNANPLDYVEGGPLNARRQQISAILDSTNPNLGAFYKRGGKLIVAVGTNDTLASPGAQLDYYQSVIDTMGRSTVDAFARLFVLPQADHGLSAKSYTVDADGKTIPVVPVPSTFDRVSLLVDWVENNKAPGRQVIVTAGERSLPMCSYPEYPKYVGGPVETASSYACAVR